MPFYYFLINLLTPKSFLIVCFLFCSGFPSQNLLIINYQTNPMRQVPLECHPRVLLKQPSWAACSCHSIERCLPVSRQASLPSVSDASKLSRCDPASGVPSVFRKLTCPSIIRRLSSRMHSEYTLARGCAFILTLQHAIKTEGQLVQS
jgi:hypothetical protein